MENFRIYLKDELALRCKKNPAYSLRAFAKHLGLSHPTLSQILSGKRPMTEKAKKQIAHSLSLSAEQLGRFQISSEITFEEQFTPLDTDVSEIFSNWIHDAILELTHLKYFQPRISWIAKVLEVSPHEISAAIDRLQRAKLLKISRTGKWKDLSENNTNNHLGNYSTSALRQYQKSVLDKSMVALENLPREERDHTSLMLKFSQKNMQEAKDLIKEFRTKFSVQAKSHQGPTDDIYVLNISFFPVSNTKESL